MAARRFLRLLYRLNLLRWRITRPIIVGVRVILEQDGAVLLVKHTYQSGWYLPGGGLKKGETLEEAARREAAEELGADLGPLRLFGVYSNLYEHKSDHIVVFTCDDFSLRASTSYEIEQVEFFDIHDVPGDVSPGSWRRINEYKEGIATPCVGRW